MMKIKINSLVLENLKIELTTDFGKCLIELEPEIAYRVGYELNNFNKSIDSLWDFSKKRISDIKEYYIKDSIESDFYGYAIDTNDNEFPLRISDAMIIFNQTFVPLYINSDLIQSESLSLEALLELAITEENFDLANELKLKIDAKNKGN